MPGAVRAADRLPAWCCLVLPGLRLRFDSPDAATVDPRLSTRSRDPLGSFPTGSLALGKSKPRARCGRRRPRAPLRGRDVPRPPSAGRLPDPCVRIALSSPSCLRASPPSGFPGPGSRARGGSPARASPRRSAQDGKKTSVAARGPQFRARQGKAKRAYGRTMASRTGGMLGDRRDVTRQSGRTKNERGDCRCDGDPTKTGLDATLHSGLYCA